MNPILAAAAQRTKRCVSKKGAYFLVSLLFPLLAFAEVELKKVAGTNNHTIKILKTIQAKDAEIFQSIMAEVERDGLVLHMNSVQLDSSGGDPVAAREIGGLIRRYKLNTFVSPGATCASACIFVAIGGVRRMIYGKVYVHRFLMASLELSEDEIYEKIEKGTRESNAYILKMGASSQLADSINTTPNWALRRLKPDEILRWGIFGSDHLGDELLFRKSAAAGGLSRENFNEKYVEYSTECRKREYRFEFTMVDCVLAKVKYNRKP